MIKALAIITAVLGAGAAVPALAQEAAPADQAADQTAPASTFSDADIKTYAGVAAQINKIQADAALSEADKQSQMAATVQKSGMDVAKFNAITEASKADPALQQKIQESVRQ